QAEDGIRDRNVTGVQTCALPIFGLTEPDFGSNPAGMITVAKETKSGWILNGAKMWITNGSTAHAAIIWAKTGKPDDVESIRGFKIGRASCREREEISEHHV